MKTKRFFSVAIVMLLCSLLLMEPISASAASYGEQNAARTAKLYLLSGALDVYKRQVLHNGYNILFTADW